MQERNEATMKNLERQVGQLAKQAERPTNVLPSDTISNPKDKGKATKWEECKAIIVGSEKTREKEAINQEEHNREVPQEETEERSEEERKTKNAKSSKKDDPGSFYIPCTIGNITIEKSFCDLGAGINLMPLSLMRKLQISELKSTRIVLQMADKSIKQALGVVENVLVKVGKFFLPADFVILDMDEDPNTPIILGRPFLATGRALIDVEKGELLLRVHDEHLAFHVFKTPHEPTQEEDGMKDKAKDQSLKEAFNELTPRLLHPCLKEVEMVQQTKEIKEELDPKPPDENLNILDKEPPRHESSPKKEEKKKRPKGWKNKKIPTEGFSPGDKVVLNTQPMKMSPQLFEYYTVNRVLSLEHLEIIKEETGRKFTVRGEKLRH
ncbi:Retrotransposon gag protein [Arachis hypogaea]|nr:Retrotransposon gag protein [Arachis hypogaea]